MRLNLASGFRAPNLAELTSHGVHEGTNRYEIGNAHLSTEQNFQADLSMEYRNEHVEFFANGFYNAVNNYIFLSPTDGISDDYTVYEYLQDDAALYGGEFGFHLHPHPLDWLHFESSFETVTGRLQNEEYLPLIPANSLRTGGYSLLSAGLESSFQIEKVNLKVGLNGTNLTDKEYVSHLSRFKPEGILNTGRSVNLNLKLEL